MEKTIIYVNFCIKDDEQKHVFLWEKHLSCFYFIPEIIVGNCFFQDVKNPEKHKNNRGHMLSWRDDIFIANVVKSPYLWALFKGLFLILVNAMKVSGMSGWGCVT